MSCPISPVAITTSAVIRLGSIPRERLAKLIKDHKFALANVYSTAGDCYAKLGKDAEARRYYSLSLAADPILNYWALTGLAGE